MQQPKQNNGPAHSTGNNQVRETHTCITSFWVIQIIQCLFSNVVADDFVGFDTLNPSEFPSI